MSNIRITQLVEKTNLVGNEWLIFDDPNNLDSTGNPKTMKTAASAVANLFSAPILTYTYVQFMALKNAAGLIPGRFYEISDATSADITMIIQATGVSSVSRLTYGRVTGVNYIYDIAADTSTENFIGGVFSGTLGTTVSGFNSSTALFMNEGDTGFSTYNTKTANTTDETFWASFAKDADGNVVKRMSISTTLGSTSATNGYSVVRFNSTYKSGGTQIDDLQLRMFGGKGSTWFGPNNTAFPGDKKIRQYGSDANNAHYEVFSSDSSKVLLFGIVNGVGYFKMETANDVEMGTGGNTHLRMISGTNFTQIIPPTSAAGLPSGALWNNGGVAAFAP